MRYKLLNAEPVTYALILEPGDEVMATLETFAAERNFKASHFSAIGAFREVELGYFDYSIKDYKKIPVNEQVEVLSLLGDIALYGDKPLVHAHVVLGKSDGSAVGGHILKAIVRPTLEIIIHESAGYLQRRLDKETGLPLIVID